MSIYQTKETIFGYCIQPAGTYGLRRGTPQVLTATSDGASNGTTLISSELSGYDGGSNDAFVSNLLECIYAGNRANKGKRTMVRVYSQGTQTMTVDAFPAQVLDGDRFMMFETPDAPIVADQVESITTQIRDATRDEEDDFWNGLLEQGGWYALVEKAATAAKGEMPLIIDFAQSGGTFTLQSPGLSGNAAIGDLFRIIRFVEVLGEMTRDRPAITREAHIGTHGTLEEERGLRAGSGTLDFYRRGPGIGRDGLPAEAHDWLSCTMDYLAGVISTAGSGSAGDQIVYSSGNHEVGQFLATAQGDLAMVVADDEVDTYTVSPAPRIDPLLGQELGRVATYTTARQLNRALTIYQWIGGIRSVFRTFYGVVPIVTISAELNSYGKFSFAVQAADWYEASRDETGAVLSRAFCARISNVGPVQSSNLRCNIGGVEFPVTSYTFTPGTMASPLINGAAPNWTDGFDIVNSQGAGQIVCTLDENTRRALDSWIAKEPLPVLIQDGAMPGVPGLQGFWAWRAQYDGATLPDNAGMRQLTLPFKVIIDQTSYCNGLPPWAIAVA